MGEIMRWDKYRHLTLLRGILVHSSKFCRISINTFVTEHLLATTSCEPNSFIKIIQLISLNYSWKISQTDKGHSNKLLPRRLFCSAWLLGSQTLRMGSLCAKNYLFRFDYHLSYPWADLISWTFLDFLKSPWWSVLCSEPS